MSKEQKIENEKIQLAVQEEGDMVVIALGHPVNWITLRPLQAIKLAEMLRKKATEVLLSDP